MQHSDLFCFLRGRIRVTQNAACSLATVFPSDILYSFPSFLESMVTQNQMTNSNLALIGRTDRQPLCAHLSYTRFSAMRSNNMLKDLYLSRSGLLSSGTNLARKNDGRIERVVKQCLFLHGVSICSADAEGEGHRRREA